MDRKKGKIDRLVEDNATCNARFLAILASTLDVLNKQKAAVAAAAQRRDQSARLTQFVPKKIESPGQCSVFFFMASSAACSTHFWFLAVFELCVRSKTKEFTIGSLSVAVSEGVCYETIS